VSDPVLDGLNPEQRRAAEITTGPVLILAGAGSGKTRVLTRRIAHLIRSGVKPWNILAVTFTNKAAGEMARRVQTLTDEVEVDSQGILVTTFHSACVRFLRRDIELLGYKRSFTIYDDDDQLRLLKDIAKRMHLDAKHWPPAKLRSTIDRAKNKMLDPAGLATALEAEPLNPSPRVFETYETELKAANAVDFNDLINLVVRLWESHPDVLARYQDRYKHLLVDEYQDTNKAQYLFVKLLAGRDRNVCVVGDDDQSIYAFRGADVNNILDFERDFPDAQVIRLEQNYRSTQNILRAASGVVKHNEKRMGKTLWTDAGDGEKIAMVAARDEQDEAEKVVEEMKALLRQGKGPRDLAVIYRTNSGSRAFEQALVRARIPHVLVGARKFYERREVRDLVSYLRLVLNPTDDLAFLRVVNVPARGIGAKGISEIQEVASREGIPLLRAVREWSEGSGRGRSGGRDFAQVIEKLQELAKTLEPGELVAQAVEITGIGPELRAEDTDEARGRLENLEELASAAESEDSSAEPLDRLVAFVDRASLAGQDEEIPDLDDSGGKATLLTAHLAKGLEFPVVFVSGMVEGSFPHFRSLEREEDIEEERRLVYVAFTRAKERLFLTRPRRRLAGGQGYVETDPSRFLAEVPREVLYTSVTAERAGYTPPASLIRAPPPRGQRPDRIDPTTRSTSHKSLALEPGTRTIVPEDPEAFQPGTRVYHPAFGPGTVKRTEGSPQNLKIEIQFDAYGRKTLYARHTNLEIIL